MSQVLCLEHLCKTYGPVCALNDLSLEVNQGDIFGFLGPNGSGKTTCIRLILGLIRPDSGRIHVFGQKMNSHSHGILERVGNLPSDVEWWPGLSGYEVLQYFAGIRNDHSVPLQGELIERFHMDDKLLRRRADTYSRGESRKLGLVAALQHDPDLAILDEPASGLDPLFRQDFYDYLLALKKRGKTVFLSSHNLHEAQSICNRVGVVLRGALMALETVDSLMERSVRKVDVSFSTEKDLEGFSVQGVKEWKADGAKASLWFNGPTNELLDALSKVSVEEISISPPSLKDFFLHSLGDKR